MRYLTLGKSLAFVTFSSPWGVIVKLSAPRVVLIKATALGALTAAYMYIYSRCSSPLVPNLRCRQVQLMTDAVVESPPPGAVPTSDDYVGCFSDMVGDRVLTTVTSNDAMTLGVSSFFFQDCELAIIVYTNTSD